MRISEGNVIVTGASRGIGRAIAQRVLEQGGRVVAVARDKAKLESLGSGDLVRPVVADLLDSACADRIVSEGIAAFGHVDGLVNCAGMSRYQLLGTIEASAFGEQLAVNLVSPLLLAQSVAAHMRERRRGAIVNVSSSLSESATPGLAAYAASKAGLNAVTRGLALELAADGIRVNAVLPGVVDTDMVRAPRTSPGEKLSSEELAARVEQQLAALRTLHPLGRLGTPEEVARVVIQVLDNEWQTGSLVVIDGGLLLR